MLLVLTSAVDLLGAGVSLWFAVYLLARGFSSRVTLRAVGVLLALAAAFFVGYLQLNLVLPGLSAIWAALLTVALVAWYDIAYQLMPLPARHRARWIARAVYLGGLIKVGLLLSLSSRLASDFREGLWIIPVWTFANSDFLPASADVLFQVFAGLATLHHLGMGASSRSGPHSQSTWLASLAGLGAVLYGALAIVIQRPLPSLPQDLLALAAVCLLGVAIADHQAFVERLTTLQDFPISSLAILGLATVYVLAASRRGITAPEVGWLAMLAVLTHSIYDIVREFLDRLLHRREGALRQELHALARNVGGESTVQNSLQLGLAALCQMLGATGGFIALRQDDGFAVSATYRSLSPGTLLQAPELESEDAGTTTLKLAERATWLAPAFAGQRKAAVVGLNARATGQPLSETDLDVLSEAADWVGLTLALEAEQKARRANLTGLAREVQTQELNLQGAAADLTAVIEKDLDPAFLRAIEFGLRHLADYAALGDSPLGTYVGAAGTTHLERGKLIRQRLVEAIDALRPAARRPSDPLPREWHSYAILHDAYVEEVPNREIMARLYVSDGTFNRYRRKALRAVARHLLETGEAPPVGRLDPAAKSGA